MANFKCKACQKEHEFVLVDGYNWGDRMLEGVMFRVYDNDGDPQLELHDKSDEAYTRQLNMDYFLKEGKVYIEHEEIYGCPECKFDIEYYKNDDGVFVGWLTDDSRYACNDPEIEQIAKEYREGTGRFARKPFNAPW